jgi:hypothetical protein
VSELVAVGHLLEIGSVKISTTGLGLDPLLCSYSTICPRSEIAKGDFKMNPAMIGWRKIGVHMAQRLMSGGHAAKKAE